MTNWVTAEEVRLFVALSAMVTAFYLTLAIVVLWGPA